MMMSFNKNILKIDNQSKTSKVILSPNIYDAYNTQNNISLNQKNKEQLIKQIRTKKFKVKREEILKFKNISEMLILRAKKESSKILSETLEDARVEVTRQRVASRVQGYKEGFEEGKAKALAEIENQKDELIKQAMIFYENAQVEAKEYISSKEEQIKKLIFEMVCKITKRQLSDNKFLSEIVYESIRNIKDQKPVLIKCSEEDYTFLHKEVKGKKEGGEVFGEFHVVIDKDITKGSFVIERNGGVIKYSLDSSLDELRKIIFSQEG